MSDQTGSIWNRVVTAIRWGSISSVNESGPVQKTQITFNDIETRDNISSISLFGFASSPLKGASVAVLAQSGYMGNGLVIGTHDPRYRPTGMNGGESKQYDALGQFVYLSSDGTITISAQHKVKIVCDTEVDITAPTVNITATSAVNIVSPQVNVQGTLAVTGEITINDVVVVAP